jgi:exopolysaccharide biosynthesis polyprenyl glycosylphosphotransferase
VTCLRVLFAMLRSKAFLAVVDIGVAHLAYSLAFAIRFGGDVHPENMGSYQLLLPYMAAALVALFLLYDLYSSQFRPWSEIASSLLISIGLLFVANLALSFYIRALAMPRSVLLLGSILQLALLTTWRYLAWAGAKRLAPKERVLVVGRSLSESRSLFDKLADLERPTCPVAILVEEPVGPEEEYLPVTHLESAIAHYQVDGVYVGSSVSPQVRRQVTETCLDKGIHIYLVPDLYEIVLSQAHLLQVGDTPFFHIGRLEPSLANRLVKRAIDLVVSLVGLVVALPVMAVVAVLIAIDSPGPIIFKQTRVTQQGRFFTMYKFRTMIHDAESRTGPVMATAEDPRTTRVGRFLRVSRLDELPQLVNILMGDMSLVGPRPERPIFVNAFSKEVSWYAHRLRVKPGLTGLAQISGRYSTSVEDKLRYDILYACSQSFVADFRILVKTLRTMLLKEKAS